MNAEELKKKIQETIQGFAGGRLTENALNLFNALGYVTERQAPLDKPTFKEFNETYIDGRKFDEVKAKASEWKYVDLLFQLSKEEVLKQISLFDTKQVDRTIIETYLFFTIELSKEKYTRTELAQITREVNRLFPMPAMILFKHGDTLTLSVINRRLHKKDESKDVLEKVTLIKDIRIADPHRAHLEILFDLSFDELKEKFQITNFVELHNAWGKILDTKELNKRFYAELFNWFLWAKQTVSFPNDLKDKDDDTVFNDESVIRLITRLIFVWFIKEKDLVPESLFDENKIKSILNDFDPKSENTSVYYRAILQNLFFATLNTAMDKDVVNKKEKRRFIHLLPEKNNPDFKDQTKYRYESYFKNPQEALGLFSSIPFLNGGLFECLDMIEEGIRYDGFSSTEGSQAFVPDKLFFAGEFMYDLNEEYGTKGKRYKVEGLINILRSYKFTITENTPLEEEIALDPELLGKVFENLLASYNSETKTTARKQTGSFYTPREIVSYMVDESLIAYLKQKLDNTEETEARLRNLFNLCSENIEFTDAETGTLIKAISEAKILDPACGSGAFPMGILHRMVDLLNKLDPENKKWFTLQKERAIAETTDVFDSGDVTEERQIRLEEINNAFDLSMNYPDYARKLFLIENCIYGVDIQQIAIQISKLRFFISLIVDQKVDDGKPNRNILSMPNLETKFVAANTLTGIEKPQGQLSLMGMNIEIANKEAQLKSIRHQIFFTRKYYAKKKLKDKEKKCREELKTILINNSMDKVAAEQLAGWNPFDPMKSAEFFDAETMFGFADGFDVVIGNPPYVSSKEICREHKVCYEKIFKVAVGQYDLFNLFIEKSITLLNEMGSHSFIIPDSFLGRSTFKNCRIFFFDNLACNSILHFNKVFEEAVVSSIVYSSSKTKNIKKNKVRYLKAETVSSWLKGNFSIVHFDQALIKNNIDAKILHLDNEKLLILKKIFNGKAALENYSKLWRGEEIGKNADFLEKSAGKNKIKILNGSNISRYIIKGEIKFIPEAAVEKSLELYNENKLIIRQLGDRINATISVNGEITTQSVYNIISNNNNLEFLLGILNSKVIDYIYQSIFREKLEFPRILLENLKLIPIPNVGKTQLKPFITIVDKILSAKENKPGADTSKLEKEIDLMVYKLYELSYDEVKVVEPEFAMERDEYDGKDFGFEYEEVEEVEKEVKEEVKKVGRRRTNEAIQGLEL